MSDAGRVADRGVVGLRVADCGVAVRKSAT